MLEHASPEDLENMAEQQPDPLLAYWGETETYDDLFINFEASLKAKSISSSRFQISRSLR
jgi:hypothetical protein